VVSVLDSGAEWPVFKTQTAHTHRASVHQAAKLVPALLMAARVTAGLAESNGSLPPGLWLTSPAGWLPRTGISSGNRTLGNRVWTTFTFLYILKLHVLLFFLTSHVRISDEPINDADSSQLHRASALTGGVAENSFATTSGSRAGDVTATSRDPANDKLARFQRPEHRQVRYRQFWIYGLPNLHVSSTSSTSV